MRPKKVATVEQKRRAVKVTRLVPAGVGHDRVFYEADVYETRFRIAWQDAHAHSDLLGTVLDTSGQDQCMAMYRPPPLTDRDRVVAATVVQWLGTNVGRCFLEDALARDPLVTNEAGDPRQGPRLRSCEPCGGPGPSLWDPKTGRYSCRSCHSDPGDVFWVDVR